MSTEILLTERSEELYRIACGIARRGEAHGGRNCFKGITDDGQRYTIDNNFLNRDKRYISIFGPDFCVDVDRGYDISTGKWGYSARVWEGQMPKNLIEILEGLQLDREWLKQINRSGFSDLSGKIYSAGASNFFIGNVFGACIGGILGFIFDDYVPGRDVNGGVIAGGIAGGLVGGTLCYVYNMIRSKMAVRSYAEKSKRSRVGLIKD